MIIAESRLTTTPPQPVLLVAREQHKLDICDQPDGRQELSLNIGSLRINALAIPAPSLTEKEWGHIQLARQSFARMWGGNGYDITSEDIFDGRDPNSPYEVTHYIAKVYDDTDSQVAEKSITMRRVALRTTDKTIQLPDDITFWNVHGDNERITPLWHYLERYLLDHGSTNPALDVAAISRSGTTPYGHRDKTRRQRERTALGFAAIQILATETNNHLLFICQLCDEFKTKALSLTSPSEQIVMLNFVKTGDTLGFPASWGLKLDDQNPDVQQHKANYPGYWVDNTDAKLTLEELIRSNKLSINDFESPIKKLLESADKDFLRYDELQLCYEILENPNGKYQDVIAFVTKPPIFKFLIPLIEENAELREAFIFHTRDGPFSSSFRPQDWRESALNLLAIAQEKYAAS